MRRLVGLALLAACTPADDVARDASRTDVPAAAATPAAGDVRVVAERWVSEADTLWDLDTPALWTDGREGRVLVTGKGSHDLRVFDAATGGTLTPIGHPGAELGAFQRPNAVVVVGDHALVVERDNARVQVLSLPEGTPTGTFGEGQLRYPYGVAWSGKPDDLTLWITDDYEVAGEAAPDLSGRVHRFHLRLDAAGRPEVLDHRAIGQSEGEGALEVVETIGVDPAAGLLFIADEARKRYLRFDTAGVFLGDALAAGWVEGDPEGVALVACGGGGGYWIATDQRPDVSLFHVFRRADLGRVGTFRGEITTNTDGVTFASVPVPGLGGPAFFAVHDDQAVAAFAWSDIAAALDLPGGCLPD